MPRIKFTKTPDLPRDLAYLGYVAGMEVDLTTDQCERWIRRQVAEYVAVAEPTPVVPAAPVIEYPLPRTATGDPDPVTVEIPDDWRELSGNKMKAVAAQVSPIPIRSKADAVAAIEVELARRASETVES